jgi:hypothetical protein
MGDEDKKKLEQKLWDIANELLGKIELMGTVPINLYSPIIFAHFKKIQNFQFASHADKTTIAKARLLLAERYQ